MKRLLIVAGAVLALSLWLAGIASADNGPHGNYSSTTDACAGCHRAHTAKGVEYLLKDAIEEDNYKDFCLSCHNGSGAYTDVKNGVFAATWPLSATYKLSETTVISGGGSLRGGGFDYAKMDTSLSGSSTGMEVSSRHVVTGGINTVWGYSGTVAVGAMNTPLTCVNCHDPHGRAGTSGAPTYRLLRGSKASRTLFANGVITVNASINGGVNVPDEPVGQMTYAVDDSAGMYFGVNYNTDVTTRTQQLSSWCAQCHTRYLAEKAAGHDQNADTLDNNIYAYRHAAKGTDTGGNYGVDYSLLNVPGCLTCHVAHGSTASMGAYSSNVAWPTGGNPAVSPSTSRSSLLRLDNRGVCYQCHSTPGQ